MIKIKRRKIPQSDSLTNCGLSPLIQRLYLARGITSPTQINYSLQNLANPEKLSNINTAAEIAVSAIKHNKKIVIVGDFDADGATATALCLRAFKAFGHHNIDFLVPNRFDFGYGLSTQLIPILQEMQTDLIITVDNGISSIEGTQAAIEQGMQVIITDHHLQANILPNADAIVNPNLNEDEFPSKNLAGVGVVFYMLEKIRAQLTADDYFSKNNLYFHNKFFFLYLFFPILLQSV